MLSVLFLCALIYSTSAISAEQVVAQCMTCHGKDGVSVIPNMPVIAGFSKPYIISAMTAYKLGERPSPMMVPLAKNLKEDEIATIAEFFAKQTFVPRKQEFDAEQAKLGKRIHDSHCNKCHTNAGRSPDDDAGILGGQWMPYLRHALEQYRAGKWPMPENMKAKIEKLTQDEAWGPAYIDALIHYYGSL
jgi:sulfide dehydrogenase cytochrome subunit